MITGISHMTFVVKDIERASFFWEKVFDAKEIYASGEKTFSISKEKFYDLNGLWICIMEGEMLTERSYNHIAFHIDDNSYDDYMHKINKMGLEIKPGRSRIPGEGRSIYFYDYDNHLFELHAGNLNERLQKYMDGRHG
jgi:catechol 2,3-dioxygenase-like lactoylglutathione lyase family enzyme